MSVIFYAAAHAVPVVLAGAATRSRGTVTLAAIVMGGLAIALGSARYAVIDLVFVAIGYFVALALCSTKAVSEPQILQGDYRKLANNPPTSLPRRDEQPSRPPPSAKPTLAKAAWLHSPAVPEVLVEKYVSYSEAGVRAKALAKKLNESVHVERGSDGAWYVGMKNPEGASLHVCFKDQHDQITLTAGRQLLIEHDADVESLLVRKDLSK